MFNRLGSILYNSICLDLGFFQLIRFLYPFYLVTNSDHFLKTIMSQLLFYFLHTYLKCIKD